MKVYGFRGTRSTRVLWTLEEAGASYEYINVDLLSGAARRPEFLAINPNGKVPAFVDGELTLSESAAICAYIADKFSSSNLAPSFGSIARAQFTQWCFFALSELEQPLWTISKHTFALPEKYRVPAIVDTACWEFARATKVLASGLGEREFIVGNSFSVADVLIANTLDWSRRLKVEIAQPSLTDYLSRMLARPALARALERETAAAKN